MPVLIHVACIAHESSYPREGLHSSDAPVMLYLWGGTVSSQKRSEGKTALATTLKCFRVAKKSCEGGVRVDKNHLGKNVPRIKRSLCMLLVRKCEQNF